MPSRPEVRTWEIPVPPELDDLSPSERLQLVEDLWDSLATTPEVIPFHNWQKDELDKRKANLVSNPRSALSWDEIVRRVRARHGR